MTSRRTSRSRSPFPIPVAGAAAPPLPSPPRPRRVRRVPGACCPRAPAPGSRTSCGSPGSATGPPGEHSGCHPRAGRPLVSFQRLTGPAFHPGLQREGPAENGVLSFREPFMNASEVLSASELYKAGKLEQAIEAQVKEVRAQPADHGKRIFLFELLAFAGDLDRARRQVDAVQYDD